MASSSQSAIVRKTQLLWGASVSQAFGGSLKKLIWRLNRKWRQNNNKNNWFLRLSLEKTNQILISPLCILTIWAPSNPTHTMQFSHSSTFLHKFSKTSQNIKKMQNIFSKKSRLLPISLHQYWLNLKNLAKSTNIRCIWASHFGNSTTNQ